MMNQPLIFTEQRIIPRVIDVVLTIMAWIGFTYLIYTGLINALINSPFMGVRPFFTTVNTIMCYGIIALVNGVILIGWAKYNQYRFRVERRNRRPGLERKELAQSLQITEEQALVLNVGRVMTVFHNENGEIAHVEFVKGIMDNQLLPTIDIKLHDPDITPKPKSEPKSAAEKAEV
jgi:biofilm PGA synthesis protein PgaD